MMFGLILACFMLMCECFRFGNTNSPAVNDTVCNSGLDYWCESFENAKRCGVVETCKKALSNPSASRRAWFYGLQKDTPYKLAKPVQVTIYFESLCPACKQTILNVIWPAFQKLAHTKIFNMEFIPFGNGELLQYGGMPIISCQHGDLECLGNIIEACAIFHMKKQTLYVPFITCLELHEPNEFSAKYCSMLLKFNYYPIAQCVHGPLGIQLHHQMAMRTKALNPPHQAVPWITLNGFHSDELQQGMMQNMIGFICGAYAGIKPAICQQYLWRK